MMLLLLMILGCPEPLDIVGDTERNARDALETTPISVRGKVVSDDGQPVSTTVKLAELETTTDADGVFEFSSLPRKNAVLTIDLQGYRPYNGGVHLYQPLSVDEVTLPVVHLQPNNGLRLFFAGDTMFGRRYVDVDGLTARAIAYPDRADSLVRASNPYPGTKQAFSFVAPLLTEADFISINLETPILRDPKTPHLLKSYCFYTLPESLEAISDAGVDYVALGNNHVYDYLEQGAADTLMNMGNSSLLFSGMGMNNTEAFVPAQTTVKGVPISLVSATSVTGNQHEINYIAGPEKAGAANAMSRFELEEAITGEVEQGRITITQLHGGDEYAWVPSENQATTMAWSAAAGSNLVIGHHPHTPQGVSLDDDGVFFANSLGNFAFDGQRHETLMSMMLHTDLSLSGEFLGADFLPIYLEDYRPRMVVGALANRMARRVASLSSGLDWTLEPGRARLTPHQEGHAPPTTTVEMQVTIGADRTALLDLRGTLSTEAYLSGLEVDGDFITAELGQDLLMYGTFEDLDIDDDVGEMSRWYYNNSEVFPCVAEHYRGVGSMCLVRRAEQNFDARLSFRHGIRMPFGGEPQNNESVTVLGYFKGKDAGEMRLKGTYALGEGELEFDEELLVSRAPGTYDWEPFSVDFDLPTQRDGVQVNAIVLRFSQGPVKSRTPGRTWVDDVAFVRWFSTELLPFTTPTPHDTEFVRLNGPPGDYTLTVHMASLVQPF